MMKLYYEIYETGDVTSTNPLSKIGPVYVADEEEAFHLHDMLKFKFIGLTYKAQVVTCNHEENKPCTTETIEEVTE